MLHMLSALLSTAQAATPQPGAPSLLLFPAPEYTLDVEALKADERWSESRHRQRVGFRLLTSGVLSATLGLPVAIIGSLEGSDVVMGVGLGAIVAGGAMVGAGGYMGISGQKQMRSALIDAGYQSNPNISRVSRAMLLGGGAGLVAGGVLEQEEVSLLGIAVFTGGCALMSIEHIRMRSVIPEHRLSLAPVLRPDEKGLRLTGVF